MRRGVCRDAQVRDAAEHHERVAGTAAQRLRPREELHQIRIVPLALLDGAPGQVVEGFEVPPRRRRLGLSAALGDVPARGGGGLKEKMEQKLKEKKLHVDHQVPLCIPARPIGRTGLGMVRNMLTD